MLKVRMFGTFLISDDAGKGAEVGGERYKRSRVWNMLAYLLYHHDRMLPWEELLRLLENRERIDDPRSTLRTILWRTRTSLEPLGEDMAHAAIISRNGMYGWNQAIPLSLDTEAFEAFCKGGLAASDDLSRIRCYASAVKLFQGHFLEKLGGEAWVDRLSAHYNRMYLEAALRLLPFLQDSGEEGELSSISEMALRIAPYDERFCRLLMESRIRQGDYQGAEDAYRAMRERLKADLDTQPEAETQAVHRELGYYMDSRYLPLRDIEGQLREQESLEGALLCDYPLFKLVYRMWLNNAGRWKDGMHIAVLSVEGRDGCLLSLQGLKRAMDQLRKVLLDTLRAQDVVSNCSAAQYVLLLSQISMESSGKACHRIVRVFAQRYPDTPVRISGQVLF